MENDPGLTMVLAPGLVLLILGIAFLRDRILYIKKGHIAIATMFKLEEREGSEGDTFYTPFFKFTSISNKEKIFEYRSTQSFNKWAPGDKIKVAYREGLTDIHDQLPLLFYDAFGLPAGLLTASLFLLLIAGGICFNISDRMLTLLISTSLVVFAGTFYIWSQHFFKKFTVNEGA
jgi:hypothetical protein